MQCMIETQREKDRADTITRGRVTNPRPKRLRRLLSHCIELDLGSARTKSRSRSRTKWSSTMQSGTSMYRAPDCRCLMCGLVKGRHTIAVGGTFLLESARKGKAFVEAIVVVGALC